MKRRNRNGKMDREPAGNCRSDLHNDRDSKKLQLGIQARHRARRCRPGGTGNGNAKMTFMAVHSSRSPKYDNVILINMFEETFGFLCQIEDDPIMKLVTYEDK